MTEDHESGDEESGFTWNRSPDEEDAPLSNPRRADEEAVPAAAEPAETPAAETVREAVLHDAREQFAYASYPPAPDDEFLAERFFDFGYLDGAEELERYWVNRPFAYVTVLYDPGAEDNRYHVVEPELDEFERYLREDLDDLLRDVLVNRKVEDGENRRQVLEAKLRELFDRYVADAPAGTLQKLRYYFHRDLLGYGPVDPILRDRHIEDVSCDGIEVPLYVYHDEFRDLETNVSFPKERLNSFVVRLAQRAGKHVSVANPMVDASLPDGSRVQLTLGQEVSTRGSNFTIRKFAEVPTTPVDLVEWGTFSAGMMAYFWLCIENNMSLVFAGGTASGKTTSMNAISLFIPRKSKVVSIEDTREVTLPHDNWVQGVTRTTGSGSARGDVNMYDLLQAALRQRPEYLLVGEIRTDPDVALAFFQAMATGHTAYTTFHADSVATVLSRLENPPLSVPTQMVQELDIVAVQRQLFREDRRVRRNVGVTELYRDEEADQQVSTDRLYSYEGASDDYRQHGDSRKLAEIRDLRGWSDEELAAQLDRRRRLLEGLAAEGLAHYETVTEAVRRFQRAPERTLDAVESGEFRQSVGGTPTDGPEWFEEDPEELASYGLGGEGG